MRIPQEVFELVSAQEGRAHASFVFEDVAQVRCPALFVDGGSAVVLSAPQYAVGVVRVYATVWEGGRRKGAKREEWFVHARRDGSVCEVAVLDGAGTTCSVALKDGQVPADVIDAVRKWCEVKSAQRMLEGMAGGVVVLDGD